MPRNSKAPVGRHLWGALWLALGLATATSLGLAQNLIGGGVQQQGSVTTDNCTKWVTSNLIADSGSTCGGGGGGGVTGSGTANKVAKWTGASAIGNSNITDTATAGQTVLDLVPSNAGSLGGDGLLLSSTTGNFGFAAQPVSGQPGTPYTQLSGFDSGTCSGSRTCPPLLYLTSARGTAPSPNALALNDWLGQIGWLGSAGTPDTYNVGAEINVYAAATFAADQSGTSFHIGTFSTSDAPAGIPPDRIVIDGSGNTNIASGELQVAGDAAWVPATLSWDALSPNNVSFFTATRAMRVKSLVGRLNVAQGTASTISVFKVPSGTAISAGTVLHSGSFNANGTANTNQTLTLSGTSSDLDLAAGDSLGVTGTGLFTVSIGSITVHMTPQ